VTDHLKALIDLLPERPFLVGHSIGGLLVQRLVNDGYDRAAVSISSAPPQGLMSFSPHFLRANFPHINPISGSQTGVDEPRAVSLRLRQHHQPFSQRRSLRPVRGSREPQRSTEHPGRSARIDFSAPGAPLLFLTGDQDHLTPVGMVRRNAHKYAAGPRTVDYQEFTGRSHYICGEQDWEKFADAALAWLSNQE